MHRRALTDRFLRSLKPGKSTQSPIMDGLVPGLGARVLKSQISFVLVRRRPGHKHPTTNALGEYAPLTPAEQRAAKHRYDVLPAEKRASLSFDEWMLQTYGATTLAAAREKARIWNRQIEAGIDPVARARAVAQPGDDTFAAVAERYIARALPKQRRGYVVERILRNEVLPHWKARPISGLSHRDVRQLVDKIVERGAPAYARNVFDAVRGVFNFAVDRGDLETSPCSSLKPARVIGAKKMARTRVLDDAELRAIWAAAAELGYPYGPLVQMLMLTGCRLNEVAGARWREFDLEAHLWTIPPERFKSETQHVVPLSDDVMALLAGLPRFAKGDHLFSATFGATPVSGLGKTKKRLDERVGAIPPWVFHDVRRSVRTRLSGLVVAEFDVGGRKVQERVKPHVAELVIGHGKRGMGKVYDQHEYVDEMREALVLWAARPRRQNRAARPAIDAGLVHIP